MTTIAQVLANLINLTFTCKPADRPIQTIEVLEVIGTHSVCVKITATTKTGAQSVNQSTMKLTTLFERMECEVAAPVEAKAA